MTKPTIKKVYTIWCAWDIGVGGIAFTSEKKALAFAKEALAEQGADETLEEALSDGLVSVEVLEVVA